MDPVDFYKAIADETRLKSLLLIQQQGELCVCELTSALALSQPKISRHLALLRKAGLLETRRDSQWVYYRPHSDLPGWARSALEVTLAENEDWLMPNTQALNCLQDRPGDRAACC